jgi:hypothetical protein
MWIYRARTLGASWRRREYGDEPVSVLEGASQGGLEIMAPTLDRYFFVLRNILLHCVTPSCVDGVARTSSRRTVHLSNHVVSSTKFSRDF